MTCDTPKRRPQASPCMQTRCRPPIGTRRPSQLVTAPTGATNRAGWSPIFVHHESTATGHASKTRHRKLAHSTLFLRRPGQGQAFPMGPANDAQEWGIPSASSPRRLPAAPTGATQKGDRIQGPPITAGDRPVPQDSGSKQARASSDADRKPKTSS